MTKKILAQTENGEFLRHQPLTRHLLKQGTLYILDATAEDNDQSLHFDGLKRIDGSLNIGVFHYIPLLFHGTETMRQQEKNLMTLHGRFFGNTQAQRLI